MVFQEKYQFLIIITQDKIQKIESEKIKLNQLKKLKEVLASGVIKEEEFNESNILL